MFFVKHKEEIKGGKDMMDDGEQNVSYTPIT